MYKETGRRSRRPKSEPACFVGTPRQIAWAREIYAQLLRDRTRVAANCSILCLMTDRMDGKELAEWYLTHLSRRQRRAVWWIAHRSELSDAWFMGEYMQQYLFAPPAPDSGESAVVSEALLRPKEPLYPGAVELIMEPDDHCPEQGVCLLRYERSSAFSQFARQTDMSWSPNHNAYMKRIDGNSAPLLDRCAEIGSRLLLSGFSVLPLDARLHTAICSGAFEWTNERWILPGSSPTRLRLVFPRNRALYRRVCALGAFWTGKSIEAPLWHSDAIRDLAQLYDFRISPEAALSMEHWRSLCLYGTIVEPNAPDTSSFAGQDPVQSILARDDSIPEDLIDDV